MTTKKFLLVLVLALVMTCAFAACEIIPPDDGPVKTPQETASEYLSERIDEVCDDILALTDSPVMNLTDAVSNFFAGNLEFEASQYVQWSTENPSAEVPSGYTSTTFAGAIDNGKAKMTLSQGQSDESAELPPPIDLYVWDNQEQNRYYLAQPDSEVSIFLDYGVYPDWLTDLAMMFIGGYSPNGEEMNFVAIASFEGLESLLDAILSVLSDFPKPQVEDFSLNADGTVALSNDYIVRVVHTFIDAAKDSALNKVITDAEKAAVEAAFTQYKADFDAFFEKVELNISLKLDIQSAEDIKLSELSVLLSYSDPENVESTPITVSLILNETELSLELDIGEAIVTFNFSNVDNYVTAAFELSLSMGAGTPVPYASMELSAVMSEITVNNEIKKIPTEMLLALSMMEFEEPVLTLSLEYSDAEDDHAFLIKGFVAGELMASAGEAGLPLSSEDTALELYVTFDEQFRLTSFQMSQTEEILDDENYKSTYTTSWYLYLEYGVASVEIPEDVYLLEESAIDLFEMISGTPNFF